MHLMLQFGAAKDDKIKEGDVEYIVGTKSYIKITKNKTGPKYNSIPCYIDVRKLGIIDEIKSFMLYMMECKYIQQGGGWYKLSKTFEELKEYFPDMISMESLIALDKNYRENDLIEAVRKNKDLYNLLQIYLIEKITDIYPANSLNTNSYRQNLINNCSYFITKDVPVRKLEENDLVDMTNKLIVEDEEDEGEDE